MWPKVDVYLKVREKRTISKMISVTIGRNSVHSDILATKNLVWMNVVFKNNQAVIGGVIVMHVIFFYI